MMEGSMTRSAELRRHFFKAFWQELLVVWPILSGLIVVQLGLGMLVGLREAWPMGEAAYFTFVTGLTIGYGDLVPEHFSTRLISVVIGFTGILLTGLVAAVGVRALQESTGREAR
jgi:hypothetical protein